MNASVMARFEPRTRALRQRAPQDIFPRQRTGNRGGGGEAPTQPHPSRRSMSPRQQYGSPTRPYPIPGELPRYTPGKPIQQMIGAPPFGPGQIPGPVRKILFQYALKKMAGKLLPPIFQLPLLYGDFMEGYDVIPGTPGQPGIPGQPGYVDLTGSRWTKVGDCGPYREDALVAGGNFCFVGSGVPESALLQTWPPGYLIVSTVQINGGEVPGGIDCTKKNQYQSNSSLFWEPAPTWVPPVPEVPPVPAGPPKFVPAADPWAKKPRNPYLPDDNPIIGLSPYPPPPPALRGIRNGTGGYGGFGPPNPRTPDGRKLPDLIGPWRPPHIIRPPGPGEKERKRILPMGAFQKFVNKAAGLLTETDDFVDAAFKALPRDVQWQFGPPGNLTIQQKLLLLYQNSRKIDMRKFAENVIKNEITDRAIGKVGQSLKKAVRNNPYWRGHRGLQAGGRYRGSPVYF